MSTSFRNLAALPFVGAASEAKILRTCVIVYSLALCVFIGSAVAYSSLDSLKREKVVVSIAPISGMDCKMLAPVRLTVDTGLAAAAFLTSNGGKCSGVQFPAPSPSSLNILYNGYFESLAECQRQVNWQITSVTTGTSGNFAVFESTTGAGSKITLSFPGGLNGCSFTTETLYSFVKTQLPDLNRQLCSPWENNSPFQCTEMETLSPLSITSQSLAIATSALALLVFLANRFLLTYGGSAENTTAPYAASSSSSIPIQQEAGTETGKLVEKSHHDNL